MAIDTEKVKTIASNRFGGCFDKDEEVVWNPDSYRGRVFSRSGERIYDPVGYASKIWSRHIRAAAAEAERKHESGAFAYVLSLLDKKVYVGMTEDPVQRMEDHLTGNGAKCLEDIVVRSVIFYPFDSVEEAKAAETALYNEIRDERGVDFVRGAGNTKAFPSQGEESS